MFTGYEDVVEWLLNNFGEKADIPTSKGRHAVHFAAAYGEPERTDIFSSTIEYLPILGMYGVTAILLFS